MERTQKWVLSYFVERENKMTDIEVMNILSEQMIKVSKSIEDSMTKYEFLKVTKIEDGKYYAQYKGGEYIMPNGTNMTFSVGNGIVVCIPNNDLKKRFIIAKY